MDAVSGERERRHVERRRLREDLEPGQADEQDDAGDELAESGQPYAPHAEAPGHSGLVALAAFRPAEQLLWPVDQVTRAETEESEG